MSVVSYFAIPHISHNTLLKADYLITLQIVMLIVPVLARHLRIAFDDELVNVKLNQEVTKWQS